MDKEIKGCCKVYSIGEIVKINLEKKKSWSFFAPDSMKGFNTKLYEPTYPGGIFITSEQDRRGYRDLDGVRHKAWDGKRRFTIRQFTPADGGIEDVSAFGAFGTLASARKAAKELSEGFIN